MSAGHTGRALVVGGDSLVGSTLLAHCRSLGLAVDATSRRPGASGLALDLAGRGDAIKAAGQLFLRDRSGIEAAHPETAVRPDLAVVELVVRRLIDIAGERLEGARLRIEKRDAPSQRHDQPPRGAHAEAAQEIGRLPYAPAAILDRIGLQVPLRVQREHDAFVVMPDEPFVTLYDVGYVNLARDTDTTVNIATEVATTGEGGVAASGKGPAQGANGSGTRVSAKAAHHFWEPLTANVGALLGVGDAETAAVIANPEAGVLSVRATARQHALVKALIDHVLTNARRQVLVEASPVDPVWGIGLAEDHPHASQPLLWPGENGLGFALMKVRRQLIGHGAAAQD